MILQVAILYCSIGNDRKEGNKASTQGYHDASLSVNQTSSVAIYGISTETVPICYTAKRRERYVAREELNVSTPWDDSLKILFSEHAQDFASWVLEGAEVLSKLSTEFAGRKALADGLLEVR